MNAALDVVHRFISAIEAKDIDILLFAAAVPYQPIPATAPLLQQRLGIADGGCAAFDINATCLSWSVGVGEAELGVAGAPLQRDVDVGRSAATRHGAAATFGESRALVLAQAAVVTGRRWNHTSQQEHRDHEYSNK